MWSDGAGFLAENPGCEYNQQGLYYSYSRQHPYLNEEEVQLVLRLLISIKYQLFLSFHVLQERVSRWIKPPTTSLVLGTLADLGRGKGEREARMSGSLPHLSKRDRIRAYAAH